MTRQMEMRRSLGAQLVALAIAGCGQSDENWADGADLQPPVEVPVAHAHCKDGSCARSAIEHVVVIVQENHSFDTYFGRYCTAAPGSEPKCNEGPACCEAGPEKEPSGASPLVLDDAENFDNDPSHLRACMEGEMNGGAMDRYVVGTDCSSPRNFVYADDAVVSYYRDLARDNALADRYFQPVAGASTANDMYFAAAGYVFDDNEHIPLAAGGGCLDEEDGPMLSLSDLSLGELLKRRDIPWKFYSEGYQDMLDAELAGTCPSAPADCPAAVDGYPCTYDAGDNPFVFYETVRNDPHHIVDLDELFRDLKGGHDHHGHGGLPSVSFVKALGYRTEHPGSTIRDGVEHVRRVIEAIHASEYAERTLILLTWDESGGYFDHVAPPPDSEVDGQPYGPRVPFIAIGPFVKKGFVSHVTMEHSSVVAFIEWNWLGETGLLGRRDATVANIGSLLDPAMTEAEVP